ncbi:hypothetical protein L596_001063 [Steinernema carpocapsae]|uniref:E1 domain-containing protein n=1 Tax=Steinernema carpocapsae TaxID=34508 RepID=A0A4U8UK68_STECR|nr:hypothetical protein L596_001063 [Steinernema carpocapsae]
MTIVNVLFLLLITIDVIFAESNFMVAFRCGFPNQFKGLDQIWKSDPSPCLDDEADILNLCKEISENRFIVAVQKYAHHVILKNWLPLEHQNDSSSTYHTRPYMCLETFENRNSLSYDQFCVLDKFFGKRRHKDVWLDEAAKRCGQNQDMELYSYALLRDKRGVHQDELLSEIHEKQKDYVGIEYVCCPEDLSNLQIFETAYSSSYKRYSTSLMAVIVTRVRKQRVFELMLENDPDEAPRYKNKIDLKFEEEVAQVKQHLAHQVEKYETKTGILLEDQLYGFSLESNGTEDEVLNTAEEALKTLVVKRNELLKDLDFVNNENRLLDKIGFELEKIDRSADRLLDELPGTLFEKGFAFWSKIRPKTRVTINGVRNVEWIYSLNDTELTAAFIDYRWMVHRRMHSDGKISDRNISAKQRLSYELGVDLGMMAWTTYMQF